MNEFVWRFQLQKVSHDCQAADHGTKQGSMRLEQQLRAYIWPTSTKQGELTRNGRCF